MLTKIKVKNYKGFKEAEIPIKPITVLLGANSSGKSSMLQLLLLLQQTAEETSDSYKSALKMFGNRISVGKPENLFYGLDRKIPIQIQIGFKNEQIKEYLLGAFSSFLMEVSVYYFGPKFREKLTNSDDRDIVSKAFDEELKNQNNYFYMWDDYCNFIGRQDVMNKDSDALMKNYDFLINLRNNIKTSSFSVTYTITYNRKQLALSGFSVQSDNLTILSYSETQQFSSDLIELNEINGMELRPYFSKNATIFNFVNTKTRKNKKTSLVTSLISIVNRILRDLQNEFREPFINHVSPLRAHPQRYYTLDKANVTYSLDTYDANAIAEVIKDKKTLKTKVNSWFKQFGLEVTVDEFKEAIHKLTVRQSGLPLDIPDVGFGVSQVLPVVLQGFLSPNKSVTIVEQPEVHLHPKMQAALADLFVDIVKESKYSKHIMVETHSEYLLKRLRRRMAEGQVITPDKVSINLFHTRTEEQPAIIENLSIEDRGYFEWPEEYYDGELSDDTNVFLTLQANGNIYTNN